MKSKSVFGGFIFVVIFAIGLLVAYTAYNPAQPVISTAIGIVAFVVALLVSAAIRIADPWDRAIVLRLGHYHSLRGPGLFLIIPIIDTIPYVVDTRVITTAFKA
ncbi:MAG TPA: SPFH domain-containing protein, partial [Puia sp.]|nr:SPFH domain-containing protein [Puia sp.]